MPYWFDGNNLIGQSAATVRADPRICRAFLTTLARYRKMRGGQFLVYFDGDDPGPGMMVPGIAVRYSAPLSADRAIVQRLQEIRTPSEVIVVTNDRELSRRSRQTGASTLDWTQFVAKMNSRFASQNSPEKPQEKVDVDEWLRFFGIENTD